MTAIKTRLYYPPSNMSEASARIKINKLLEAAGWRFFADAEGPANIQLEPKVTLTVKALDALGENFEKTERGFVDFLLLDSRGAALVVLEAKDELKNPLDGKEQARKYARSQNCRYVMLSNGNLHYFWDLEQGNPFLIQAFPPPTSIVEYQKKPVPNPKLLGDEPVANDYIVLTQLPTYKSDAGWINDSERSEFCKRNKLRFLREYQLRAIHQLQAAVREGKDRFLFEMATGTGKTLTAAAVIKLFRRTGNAHRVLFLVDRLELEQQAYKAFTQLLSKDCKTVIYKQNKADWRHAEIVVTTVQSLLFNDKYKTQFSPLDFDLVISDEAHRSIGGNARAVFEYFQGYKLGLTATPRDYLRKFEGATTHDPREAERRLLLDTYKTFGCESGEPTFRYGLLDGVRDGFLINPTVVDARSEVTTQLLSEDGFVVTATDDTGEDVEETYKQREFERKFFSESTNMLFCQTFLNHALRDPISNEIGKSIIFAVSQNHASKLTQILNELADRYFPGWYQSDFAMQVTSRIPDSQQMTVNFANNNLGGSENRIAGYKTSKTRVCVTVGMMTTGYDCTDLLNLGLFRPIFSPSEFVQIKGRGTRPHEFLNELHNDALRGEIGQPKKSSYKLFDFFATCEYFESEFDYDEVLKLPKPGSPREGDPPLPTPPKPDGSYEHLGADILASMQEVAVGADGMKIDRMYWNRFEETVLADSTLAHAVEAGDWDRVIDHVNREVFDKPEDFFTLDKLRRAVGIDRRLSLREILEKVFGLIPGFKSRQELLEEEFAKFVAAHVPEEVESIPAIARYFTAYLTNGRLRDIIDSRQYTELATHAAFPSADFKAVPDKYRTLVPNYIKDYVSLNRFAA